MVDERIEIRRANNGYYVTRIYLNEEPDTAGYDKEVFESDETPEGDNEALKKLLYAVAEWAGRSHDKYADNNLNITFDLRGSKADE